MALVLRSKIYINSKEYEYALFDLKNASERESNKCYFDIKYMISFIYYEIYIGMNIQNKKRIPDRILIENNWKIHFLKSLTKIESIVKEMGGINYKILNLYLKLKRKQISKIIKLKASDSRGFLIDSKDRISEENIKILRKEYLGVKIIIENVMSRENSVKFDFLNEDYLFNKDEFYREYEIVKLYGRKRKNGNIIDLNY